MRATLEGDGVAAGLAPAAIAPPPAPARPAARTDLADALVLAGLIAAVCWCTWRLREGYADDALILLRYAHNLLAGEGWVYNAGEAVNATTSPLHALFVAAIAWGVGGDLLLAQPIAFALPLAVVVALAYGLLRPHGRLPAAMAGLLLATAPRIYTTVGMESTLLVATALAACTAAARGQHGRAGLFAGAASLARPDAALLAAILAVRARQQGWRPALRLGLAAGLTVAPWLVFATAKFGSPLPNTLAIKLAQRRLFHDVPIFLNGAWRELAAIDSRLLGAGPPVLIALFALALAVLFARARSHAAAALFAAWALLQFAAYAALDLPPYHWYYAPILVAAALATAVLFATLWQRQRPAAMLLGLGLGAGLLATALPEVLVPEPPTRQHYRDAGHWLAAHTPVDCSIAAGDIGIIGFHALPRRIVDMQGLVTPGAAAAIAAGDTGWWFDRHRPDFVVMHTAPWPEFEGPVAARAEFQREYRRIAGTGLRGMEVWQRVPQPR